MNSSILFENSRGPTPRAVAEYDSGEIGNEEQGTSMTQPAIKGW